MARRKKIYFNYWELPPWENAEIFVAHVFRHKNKEYLLLRDGVNDYSVKRPKRLKWNEVKKLDKLRITRELTSDKRAILHIE